MKPKQATLALALAVLLALTGCGLITTSTNTYYYNPSWLPDGRIICTKFVNEVEHHLIIGGQKDLKKEHYITTMNDDGSNEQNVRKIDSVTGGGEIAASPDGRYIAIASGNKIRVFNSDFSDYSTVTPSDGKLIEHLDFSPTSEGYKIVYTNEDKELRLTDISAAFNNLLTTSADYVAWRVGEEILFVTYSGTDNALTVSIMNTDGTNIRFLKTFASDPQMMNGGNSVIYRGLGNEVRRINFDGLNDLLLYSNHKGNSLKLSYDNAKIASGDLDGSEILNVYVTDISTGVTTRLR